MKKVIILRHQNEMKYSKDYFQMQVPKELSRTIYFIVCICVLIFVMICFGRIDEVIKTNGFVRTLSNVSAINNVIAGQIVEKNYQPGQKIEKGSVLYKIDSTSYEAQRASLLYEIQDLQYHITGLESLINSYYADKNLCNINDTLSFSRFEAYLKSKEVLEVKESISKKEYLMEKDKPQLEYVPYQVDMKLKALNLVQADLDSFKTTFIATINYELNEKLLNLYEVQQELLKLDNQYQFLEVKSPMDGYIQEISSLNVGDFLEANAKVLNIIPNDEKNFRVELWIPPKDIGKVLVGQKVKYRLSAFPYFEYKGAEGVITSIDPDIRTESDERKQYYYSVFADIDRISFSNRHGESFLIRAGLETDARIVLERKSILYFILKKLDFLN